MYVAKTFVDHMKTVKASTLKVSSFTVTIWLAIEESDSLYKHVVLLF